MAAFYLRRVNTILLSFSSQIIKSNLTVEMNSFPIAQQTKYF